MLRAKRIVENARKDDAMLAGTGSVAACLLGVSTELSQLQPEVPCLENSHTDEEPCHIKRAMQWCVKNYLNVRMLWFDCMSITGASVMPSVLSSTFERVTALACLQKRLSPYKAIDF